jgi:hypothetical protein
MLQKFRILITTFSIISFILVCCVTHAATGDGGDAGAFLKNGLGVRPISMGKAFVAVADDTNAGYWNPAGLAIMHSPQMSAMYSNPMNYALIGGAGVKDIGYHTVSAAYPMRFGAVGLNLAYLSVGDIEEVIKGSNGEPIFTGNKFEDKELAVILSYANSITDQVQLGLNLKFVQQSLWDNKGSGIGLDIGALYEPVYNLTLGLMLQDLVEPKLKLLEDGTEYSIPRKLRLGISYKMMDDMVLVATDIDKASGRSVKFHVGAEIEPMKDLAFRVGYTTDTGEISAGVGVQVSLIQLDYGFGFLNLGSTHRVSLTIDFSRLGI